MRYYDAIMTLLWRYHVIMKLSWSYYGVIMVSLWRYYEYTELSWS